MKHRSNRVDRLVEDLHKDRQKEEGDRVGASARKDLARLVREYFYPHRKSILFSYIVICLWAVIPYAFSFTWRFLFDHVLIFGGDPAPHLLDHRIHLLWIYIAMNTGVWALWCIFCWLFHWVSVRMGLQIIFTFRKQMHEKLQSLHIGFYEKNPTGRLMSRVMDDVEVIRNLLISHMSTLVGSLTKIIAGLIVIFYLDWRTSSLIVIALPFYAWTFAALRPMIRKINIALRHLNSMMYAIATERISGVQVVSAFARERREILSFSRMSHNVVRLRLRNVFYNQLLSLAAALVSATATVGIIYWGTLRIKAGTISLGDMLALISAAGVMFTPVNQLVTFMIQAQAFMVVIHRVFRLMDEPEEVVPGSVLLQGIKGKIRFDNVTFSYPGQQAPSLYNFSLTVSPGEKIAIMGSSGAGKSTVLHLLMRFYDPQEGEVRVGGVNLRDADSGSVRRHVCMVQQEPTVFSGTIADNIAYGVLDASPTQIMGAAQQAELHDLIMSLPAKYETEVGENGVTLSGGQKQRLALATALLTNPEILLMDDTTSALDANTEKRIRETLEKALRGRTSITITHRIATARGCDRIIVLEHGRVVQAGTHSELLDQEGFYRLSAMQQGWVLPTHD